MSNTYFQFKQFIVHQEHTAMKVCTDACLFGAWLAQDKNILNATTLLDIGTGTGLLSLMVAQAKTQSPLLNESTPFITALEIETDAAEEAKSNVQKSPWQDHINVLNTSLQDYCEDRSISHLFDCIFSNPPFFEGDLLSPNIHKNLAAHSTALPWPTLVQNLSEILNFGGYYYVLIPALRAYTMQKLATQNGMELVEEVVVYNAAGQKPFRVLQKFQKTNQPIPTVLRSNFIIKEAEQSYTATFIHLLKNYYLHL